DLPRLHDPAGAQLPAYRRAAAPLEHAVLRGADDQQRAAVLRSGRLPQPRGGPAAVAAHRGADRAAVPALRLHLGRGGGPAMIDFMSGAITLGFLLAGVFFLRFWRRTADRLFLAFAIAFALFGLNQALATLLEVDSEPTSFIYALRVIGFLLILV